jgi:hypothetical protein
MPHRGSPIRSPLDLLIAVAVIAAMAAIVFLFL